MYLEKNGISQTKITHSIIKKFLKDQFYLLNFKLLPLYNEQQDDKNGLPLSNEQQDDENGLPLSNEQQDDENGLPLSNEQQDDENGLPLSNEQQDDENGNEEFYLFIWCILTDRLDIARIFWRLGKVWLHP